MKIGDTIRRKDKITDKLGDFIEIKTQKDLEYHQDLAKKGVVYTVIHQPKEFGCESCQS